MRDLSLFTNWATLARYLSGESEPGEAEVVRRWIDVSPDRAALVDALRHVWAEAAVPRQEWDVDAAVQRIMVNVESRELVMSPRWRWRRFGQIAAAAAAVVLLTIGVRRWGPAVAGSLSTVTLGPYEYVTQRGESARLTLSDGTKIVLAPSSRLRVPRKLDSSLRSVHLEGQALFEVTHDAKRPFRVQTSRAVAADLGTTFVVRDYANAQDVTVMVTEGVVSLRSRSKRLSAGTVSQDSLLLQPGDLGRVSVNGTLNSEHHVPADAYTAWTEGRLVFHRTPLKEIAEELNRWYDLQVRIPDTMTASRRVTVSFGDQPAPDVLRFVALSLGLRIQYEGQVIVLAPADGTDR